MFCCIENDSKRKSVNSYALTTDGQVGAITTIDGEIVTMNKLTPIHSPFWYLHDLQMSDSERDWFRTLQSILQTSRSLFFDIVDISKTDRIYQTEFANLLAPCMLMPCRKLGANAFFAVPVYDFMHD